MSRFTHVLITICVCASVALPLSGSRARAAGSSSLTQSNQRAQLTRYLQQVLEPVSKVARVYYYVPHACSGGGPDAAVQFPPMDLRKPSHGEVGIRGVRSIFSAYHGVTVTQRAGKLVAVQIGTPSNYILMTRIKLEKFDDISKYNPGLLIMGVMHKKAVRNAISKANLTLPITPFVGMVMPPAERRRHLPVQTEDVTVDGALDRIAVAFNGVVVYSVCEARSGKRVVQVYFDAFN